MPLEDPQVVLDALRAASWIRSDAARALGVSRQGLYKAMARHGIEAESPDPDLLRAAFGRGPRPPRKRAA